MSKKLGGSLFIYNGVQQDYSFVEAIKCLQDLCDEVSVVDAGSQDGTVDILKTLEDSKTKITYLSKDEWDDRHGHEKLSFFMNRAIDLLDTEWQFALQGDECIHENSFHYIRHAIEQDAEAYLVHRINLWGSPYTCLNVEQHRKPVSTEIIRLAKNQYRAFNDGESLQAPCTALIPVRVYHTGFVRDKYKHLVKINHIQKEVFLWDVDKRVNDCKDGFNPWKWGFTPADVVPIEEPLPKYIKQWAEDRIVPVFQEEDYDLAVKWCRDLNIDLPYLSNERLIEFTNELWYKMSSHYQKITPGTSSEPGV